MGVMITNKPIKIKEIDDINIIHRSPTFEEYIFLRDSNEMIKNSGEFVINVPNVNILSQVHYCGTISGRDADKFKQSRLTPLPAKKVTPPLISECIAHIECKIQDVYPTGDHSIFVGEVLAASVVDSLFDGCWKTDEAKTLHHLGGNLYTTPRRQPIHHSG